MAEFVFTIADEDMPRLVAGLCAGANLELTIENTREVAIQMVRNRVFDYERIEAEKAAAQALDLLDIS